MNVHVCVLTSAPARCVRAQDVATRGTKKLGGCAFPTNEGVIITECWNFWRETDEWEIFVESGVQLVPDEEGEEGARSPVVSPQRGGPDMDMPMAVDGGGEAGEGEGGAAEDWPAAIALAGLAAARREAEAAEPPFRPTVRPIALLR